MNKSPLLIAFLTIALISCNSFDQEAFDQGFNSDQEAGYEVPKTVPVSVSQVKQFLHGDSSHKWTAREFKLEGLLGNQDCRLDDTMILGGDGTYQFDGGEMSCGGADVSSRSGVYRLDFDNQKLIFDEGTNEEVKVTISGLDQEVIVLSGQVDVFGITMDIEGVYTID